MKKKIFYFLILSALMAACQPECPELEPKIIYQDTTIIKNDTTRLPPVSIDTTRIIFDIDTFINWVYDIERDTVYKRDTVYVQGTDPCQAEKNRLFELYGKLKDNADSIMAASNAIIAIDPAFYSKARQYLSLYATTTKEDTIRSYWQTVVYWQGFPDVDEFLADMDAIIRLYNDRLVLKQQAQDALNDVLACVTLTAVQNAPAKSAAAYPQITFKNLARETAARYLNRKNNKKTTYIRGLLRTSQ